MKVVWLVCTVRPSALTTAGGERGLEAKGIADGENFLADLQLFPESPSDSVTRCFPLGSISRARRRCAGRAPMNFAG